MSPIRMIAGTRAQQVGDAARGVRGYLGRFRDNATIRVLMREDVMERLQYIGKLPPENVSEAVILSVLPQLFEGADK